MSTNNFLFKYKSLFLECEIDYLPSEKGSREVGTGLQLDPDYNAVAEVVSVCLEGVDITEIIREDILDEISDTFLNQELEDYDYE